jgi:hypothetical protein
LKGSPRQQVAKSHNFYLHYSGSPRFGAYRADVPEQVSHYAQIFAREIDYLIRKVISPRWRQGNIRHRFCGRVFINLRQCRLRSRLSSPDFEIGAKPVIEAATLFRVPGLKAATYGFSRVDDNPHRGALADLCDFLFSLAFEDFFKM